MVVPYILTAPYYFIDKITLGQMQQTVGAFSSVQGALTFFITSYSTIADYKAVIDRLTTFEAAIASARASAARASVTEAPRPRLRVRISKCAARRRALLRADDARFRHGEITLLTGPSGSGKSTLFRAISGIWPFGKGKVACRRGNHDAPAAAALYPHRHAARRHHLSGQCTAITTTRPIAEALTAAKLPALVDKLDEERDWAQTLSLGEQQRLAIARALLAKPDWLLLDEATAALDEPTEAEIYRILKKKLPETTIVSIGHRSTLAAFHDRRIGMQKTESGLSTPVDLRQAEPAE